jgi:hypothetical protein
MTSLSHRSHTNIPYKSYLEHEYCYRPSHIARLYESSADVLTDVVESKPLVYGTSNISLLVR